METLFDPALHEALLRHDPQIEALIELNPGAEPPPGVSLVARFGNIATCRLGWAEVKRVRQHPAVVSLKAARPLGPLAPEEMVIVDAEHVGPAALPPPDRPDRPIIAILDWGCDFAHPQLRWRDGTTRLLGLWDQAARLDHPSTRYGYGRAHTAEAINQALRSDDPYAYLGHDPRRSDPSGRGSHGTHVCGIAAGLAPSADLLFVHLASRDREPLHNLGDSVGLLEAIDWVHQQAGDRPCCINASLGRHGGPHNGLTLVERAIDTFLSEHPGRFLVQSAGNYRQARVHVSGRVTSGVTDVLEVIIQQGDPTPNEIEIWYPGADRFTVSITPPTGEALDPIQLGSWREVVVGGQAVGRAYHRARDPQGGDQHIDIFLDASAPPGRWRIALHGDDVLDGRYHAWIERDGGCPTCQVHFAGMVDPYTTLGTLANGRHPLVVGAYDPHAPGRPMAGFSSVGPTRDGRIKPDLLAPGVRILGPRSAPPHAEAGHGAQVRMSGTSMAAPHATGTVARIFEQAGPLPCREVRHLLLSTAEPMSPADACGPIEGVGRLDQEAAVAAARSRAPQSPSTQQQKAGMMNTLTDEIGAGTEEACGCGKASTETDSEVDSEAWALPPDVAAVGQQQSVRYDDGPAWDETRCAGGLTSGARVLADFLKLRFAGISRIGGYSCRRNTASPARMSIHGTGRALDIMIPPRGGRADTAVGDPIANWLVSHAAALGVQLIIWNRTLWNGSRSGRKDRSYRGPNPHIDHLHVEINEEAARRSDLPNLQEEEICPDWSEPEEEAAFEPSLNAAQVPVPNPFFGHDPQPHPEHIELPDTVEWMDHLVQSPLAAEAGDRWLETLSLPTGLFSLFEANELPGLAVLGAPGQRLSRPLRRGDVVVRRLPGQREHLSVVASHGLHTRESLPTLGLMGESSAPGRYAHIAEGGTRPHTSSARFARRVTGHTGHVLADTLILGSNEPGESILRAGMAGPEVGELQAKLNRWHHLQQMQGRPGLPQAPLAEDGSFGPRTRAAVIAFQQQAFAGDPRQVDGVVGPQTRAALDSALFAAPPAPPIPSPILPSPANPLIVEIKLRLFIPSPLVGLPVAPPAWAPGLIYAGDGRGFDYARGTERVLAIAQIGFDPRYAPANGLVSPPILSFGTTEEYPHTAGRPVSGKPWWWWDFAGTPPAPCAKTEVVHPGTLDLKSRLVGPGEYEVRITINGVLGACDPIVRRSAPAINADLQVHLRSRAGSLEYQLAGSHDGFPAYELYLNARRVHHYDPVAAGASPLHLAGGHTVHLHGRPWVTLRAPAAAISP